MNGVTQWEAKEIIREKNALIKEQAEYLQRLREENLQLRSEMTMIELDSFETYDDWCFRGLPEEAIHFADRTHQRAKAVLLGKEYDGD